MRKSYDSSKKGELRRKIRQRIAEKGFKKRSNKRKSSSSILTTGVINFRAANPVTLPELLQKIENEITRNTSIVKRLKLSNEMRSEMERSYTVHTKINNMTEYTERYSIGSRVMELCIPTPSEKLSKPESKNWFFGDTINKELFDIFAAYMEAGIEEAYKSIKSIKNEIRSRRKKFKLKRRLDTLVFPDFDRVDTSDLIQDIKIKKMEDMVPERVYLLPYGIAMPYGGYAYFDDAAAININVNSILGDKIRASNPLEPNSCTAAHEIIHATIQQNGRYFHCEHLTHLIDFMAMNKRTFFFEFLGHPYTRDVEILDVVDLYLDDEILPLYNIIKGVRWDDIDSAQIFWQKDLLARTRLIEEKLDNIRQDAIQVMKNAEAEYNSLDKYGLDTLVILTGMETFPLWLAAVKEFEEPIIETEEKRREFRREYGKTLHDIIKDVKETYFEEAKENLHQRSFYGLEYTIRDAFEDALDDHYDLTPNERKLAWDMFVRSFINEEDEVKYEHVTPGDVLSVVNKSAEDLIRILEEANLSPDKARNILDRLQLFDYIGIKLGPAQDLAEIREKLFTDEDKLTEAKEVAEYDAKVLLPETDILEYYEQTVYGDGENMYSFDSTFKRRLAKMKKKITKISLPDIKEKSSKRLHYFKIVQYFEEEDKCVFIAIHRGRKKKSKMRYEPKPKAIMFSADGSDRLNAMPYSSKTNPKTPGYGHFDSLITNDEGFRTPPFDVLIEPEEETLYQKGKEAYSKLDWVRKKRKNST